MNPKQLAGEAAVKLIAHDMIVGLGTGSTADFFLIALADAIKSGKLRGIRGVPTSKRSEQRAIELGIPLTKLADAPHPDITIDGADEVAPNVDVIKGLGGALLREKVVAQNSKKFVIIADSTKTVDVLGTKGPLPVEVTLFGSEIQPAFLRSLGCEPELRKQPDSTAPFVTDNGNYIYHCRFPSIDDPAALDRALKARAGVVETGLFLGIASLALIATDHDVQQITRRA